MGRVLGLDVGDKRIGVALSDESRLIASPYCVIHSVGWGPDSRRIADIMRETGAELIVSGLPYNMDGSLGFQAKKVQDFLQVVEGLGFPVLWMDERLTTVSAQRALIAGGMRRQERREHVDKVAAAVILQAWLDQQRADITDKTNTEKEQLMSDNEKNLRMEDNGENENELPDIIELTDDEGNVTRFEYMTTIDYEGALYVALMLAEEEEEEEGNVVILKIDQDENGEDIYVSIEDEALADAVFQKFLEMVDEADFE